MGVVTDSELLPAPPRRVPGLSTIEQQAKSLSILIQHAAGPGHARLRAALSDALAVAVGAPCAARHVRLPRKGDTEMSCQRCSWTRAITADDIDKELSLLERHLSLARAAA